MKYLLGPTMCLALIGSVDPKLGPHSSGEVMIHIFMAYADVTSSQQCFAKLRN